MTTYITLATDPRASVVHSTYSSDAPLAVVPLGQAWRDLPVHDRMVSVVVDVDLDDLLRTHAEGAAGSDCDEHDYLHGLAFGVGLPNDSTYRVIGMGVGGLLMVEYSTSVDGFDEED